MGEQFSASPAGNLVGTSPPVGTSVPSGGKVQLGQFFPRGGPTWPTTTGPRSARGRAPGKAATTLPAGPGPANKPSWSADGKSLVYVQGPQASGQLMSIAVGRSGARRSVARAATTASRVRPHDLRAAARVHRRLGRRVAAVLRRVRSNQLNPSCTSHPGWTLGRQIAWSRSGSKILVFGTQNGTNNQVFGLIEFTSNVPFSTQASVWGQGTVVTNIATSGEGVIAGVFSPNGKQLALVSNIGGAGFHLLIAPPGHFKLAGAKAFAIAACQVAWRLGQQAARGRAGVRLELHVDARRYCCGRPERAEQSAHLDRHPGRVSGMATPLARWLNNRQRSRRSSQPQATSCSCCPMARAYRSGRR